MKRVVKPGNVLESLSSTPWNTAPIIVFRNNLRNAINLGDVIRKSKEDSSQFIICVANDTFSKKSIVNNDIMRYALNLDDKKTQNLPGYLPLASGIPLMLTRSLFTEIGLSNGTIGIFKQLIYEDEDIENTDKDVQNTDLFPEDTIYIRKPLYILMELVETKPLPKMKNLSPKIVPIPVDTQSFDIDLKNLFPLKKFKNCPKLKVCRKQFPLTPAYSFTSHRSQGQTIPKVILDLILPPPPIGVEPALSYVPLTRVRNLNDLAFFRDFPISSIQIQPSVDQKQEILRLKTLNNETTTKFAKQYPSN